LTTEPRLPAPNRCRRQQLSIAAKSRPVWLPGTAATSSGGPAATTMPPCEPLRAEVDHPVGRLDDVECRPVVGSSSRSMVWPVERLASSEAHHPAAPRRPTAWWPADLCWTLENLVTGRVVSRITVDDATAADARIALDRMLAIT
jgi:hypothetical protein